MDINAYIILKNKRLKHISVSPEKEYFFYNNSVYVLDSRSIGLRSINGKLSPKPMCFYFEGIPTAIRIEPKEQDESAKLLDKFIQETNIRLTSTARPSRFTWLIEYIQHPQKIFMLFVFTSLGIYIAYYILSLIFSGGV